MNPILLATVALVGLPVLLHLIMKQEPKKLLFPAVRFLMQKKRINERKVRLKHYLLMALRMLLIALFGLALYQPTLSGEFGGFTFNGEQPVAVAIIIDSSASMGYVANDRTRFAEAKRRALELLDECPSGSRVAILDPADPAAGWELSVADARRKLDTLKEPTSTTVALTTTIATAYQLLGTVDQESETTEPMPRLVAIFTDRAAACWDTTRTPDLVKLRDSIPPPAVAQLMVDVGIDQPANLAITNIELKPQVISAGQPVVLNASVAASGPEVETTIVCKIVTAPNVPEQRQAVKVGAGAIVGVAFKYDGRSLPAGLHHAELTIEAPDKLDADNTRYVTFRIAEPRKILTLCDTPADAEFWQLAHTAKGEFECEVKQSGDAPDFAPYEAVCLLNVADPNRLWPRLTTYAERGGKVLLLPGAEAKPDAYSATNEAASRLLPASLKAITDTATLPKPVPPATLDRTRGVSWLLDDSALKHPLLAPFREWKQRGNVDILQTPRRAQKYWTVEPTADSITIVKFDAFDDVAKCPPALIERPIGTLGGRVVMLTTRLDTPRDAFNVWNDYWDFSTSWIVAFPNLLLRYLAGDPSEVNLNYQTGQAVIVALPRGERKPEWKLSIEGRGISGRDAEQDLSETQTEVRFPPSKTSQAGNFTVSLPDDPQKWRDGFSLNPPPDESTLDKVPIEGIEPLLGVGSVVPIAKEFKLRDVLQTKFDQPVDLFPWLLILVLFLFAGESVLANRFYRV